ncbi:hypothetical protein CEXT_117061 [Caerostris extrusa]|uniref:Uncharacterized protein n=1 Tax=Caerostris extrusa TaxID=172846 RepID=A0AAV4QLF6_CAEEX|nr:hypothetical protein CEXT_117061 [Caerostris extrusa]
MYNVSVRGRPTPTPFSPGEFSGWAPTPESFFSKEFSFSILCSSMVYSSRFGSCGNYSLHLSPFVFRKSIRLSKTPTGPTPPASTPA